MAQRLDQRMIAGVRDRWQVIRDAWQRFWYQPDDPIGISLLRIATGLVLMYTLAIWSLDLSAFFGNQSGWQSAELVQQLQHDQWAYSFWWLVSDQYQWLAHAVSLLLVTAFTIGLQTRITKFAALLICISYANRVPMAQFGLDQVTSAWLLYLCLGPCGARLSVDRWWADRAARRSGGQASIVRSSSAARLTMRMVQVHLCVIYLWAGISKLQGSSWLSGEAVWWVASNYEHQYASLAWLAYVPWLYQIITITTWAWEVSFPFLIWNRWLRTALLTIGMGMHVGIGVFLGLWPFALIMVFGYLSFVPTESLNRWVPSIVGLLGWQSRREPQSAVKVLTQPSEMQPSQEFAPEKMAFPMPQLATSRRLNQDARTSVATSITAAKPVQGNNRTASKSPKRVRTMLAENDRDNMVLFVERSARRRCSLIRALEDYGYRCIGLDAWPEAIEVYNVLKPRCIMCNGYRMPSSELRFWRSQLDERPDSVFVVLVEPQHVAQFTSDDRRTVGIAIPASFDQICAALDGSVDPTMGGGPRPPAAPSSEADEDQGDQIFSLTTRNRPR